MSLHRHRSRSLGTGYRYARGVAVDRTVFPPNPHVDVMALGHGTFREVIEGKRGPGAGALTHGTGAFYEAMRTQTRGCTEGRHGEGSRLRG